MRRIGAGFALVVYAAAALVYPELHRRHHARFGADHVHGATGTRYFHDAAAFDDRSFENRGFENRGFENRGFENRGFENRGFENRGFDDRGVDLAAHHAAFDVDLAALALADVATAGTLAVDCALAEYTGVDCATAAPGHAPNFGDVLLARQTHRHAPDVDPLHALGALEHLQASAVATPHFALPPPVRSIAVAVVFAPAASPPSFAARAHDSRGPPRA